MSHKGPFKIPEIDKVTVMGMMKHIEVLVPDNDGFYAIEKPDPWEVAFLWDPKRKGPYKPGPLLATIRALHPWAYYGLFRPVIVDVLAFIPEHLREQVHAFASCSAPEDAANLRYEEDALEAGFHVAYWALYGAPEEG